MKKTDRKPRTARKAPFLTGLALACALMTGSTGATIPVADVGNMPNHIITQIQSYLNQINTYTQRFQDAAQYAAHVQHMTQQLIQIDQMIFAMGLTMTTMNEKPLTEGVVERCNGGNGSMLSDLFAAVGLSLNGDITAQQKQKCGQIVTLQNMKYNEQVRMLRKLQQSQMQISTLQTNLGTATSNGAMDTNIGAAQGIMTQMMADAQYAQTIVRVYDGMIESLKEDQKALAKRALGGQTSMIGAMISTAALAGALEIND